MDWIRRQANEEEMAAVSSPLRLRILRLCLDASLSNKQIAERLGRDPASVLYHVRRLVDAGFLVAGEPRRGTRGSREVPYRSTGKSWTIDVGDQTAGPYEPNLLLETFLEDVRRIGPGRVEASRLGIRLTPQEYEEFKGRLQELLDEYAGRTSAGDPWSLFVGLHPDDRPVPEEPTAGPTLAAKPDADGSGA
jgi:DNA-binding transcriptional ArsR family regulator